LIASMPRALFSGAFAGMREATSSDIHSSTSNSVSTPTSLRFCWTNSFIIRGCIWPEPLVEIAIFSFSGLSGP
jgi:hypothetical protein